MSFFDWLLSLFEPSRPDREPLVLESPASIERDEDEIIEVSLNCTQRLYDRNGRIPEQMVARQLAHALDKTEYGYSITFNHYPIDTKSEQAVCGDTSALHEWKDMDERHIAKDSNVLITDANGGGCGFVGGNACTTPGRNISRLVVPANSGYGDRLYNNLSGNLHEIGHNLALPHDHDKDKEGKQHSGTGWNDHAQEMWHRTPMNVANGVTNICGEEIPKREYDDVVSELYYHDCAVARFEVQ